jgi:hypothetical protein
VGTGTLHSRKDNPPGALKESKGIWLENKEILSLDGAQPKKEETPDSYAKRFPRSQIVFWWSDEMNCRQPGKFIALRERRLCLLPLLLQDDTLQCVAGSASSKV